MKETLGQKESGVESLHMSSDESDTEERIVRRRERHRDSAVEPPVEHVDESASRQAPHDPLPVSAVDHIPFDAELAAVQVEGELLTRDDAVHNGLSPDDETALCEAVALVEALPSEPGMIPDPTLVLPRVHLYRPGNLQPGSHLNRPVTHCPGPPVGRAPQGLHEHDASVGAGASPPVRLVNS